MFWVLERQLYETVVREMLCFSKATEVQYVRATVQISKEQKFGKEKTYKKDGKARLAR